MDGALLGSPMALVGGMAGREGRTELRKATGFWMRLVGETGAGDTQRGWNWFPLEMENVSGTCAGSVGPGEGSGSFWMETPPRDLVWAEGWVAKRLSLLTVLCMAWGVLLRVNTGELEGDTEATVVLVEGKKCFGRAKLNVCDGGAFACLLDIVTAGTAVEFKTLMLKGNSLGDEGDGFCNCCCSSKTWLWSCCSWLESLHTKQEWGGRRETVTITSPIRKCPESLFIVGLLKKFFQKSEWTFWSTQYLLRMHSQSGQQSANQFLVNSLLLSRSVWLPGRSGKATVMHNSMRHHLLTFCPLCCDPGVGQCSRMFKN